MRTWFTTEDGWAVWLGLLVVALALPAVGGVDLLGWVAAPQVWLEVSKAVAPASKTYAGLPGWLAIGLTYLAMVGLLVPGAWAMRWDVRRFIAAFTVIFALSYLCWVAGHYAYIAQTPDKRAAMGLSWS